MSFLYCHAEGSGPPLVFLHGFCDSHGLWKEFIPAFVSSFRVLAPDLPGFGSSEMLPTPFSLDDVGDAIASWIESNSLVKPVVIGHSLGGYIALSLLERHARLLSGVGLFHSTPYGDSNERKEVRKKVIEFVRKNGVEPFVETFVPGLFLDKSNPAIPAAKKRALATSADALIGYSVAMANRPDRSETFVDSQIPCLLIAGTEDALIPIKSLRKSIKKCLFYELPNVAHMGVFEAKKQCQEMILRFATGIFQ